MSEKVLLIKDESTILKLDSDVSWGSIKGSISNQADLSAALNSKAAVSRQILAGSGLTGGGDLSADRTLALSDTGVVFGSYGSALQAPVISVDTKGRISSAVSTPIQTANSEQPGLVSAADWNTFNSKQAALISGTNIKTLYGSSLLGAGDIAPTGRNILIYESYNLGSFSAGNIAEEVFETFTIPAQYFVQGNEFRITLAGELLTNTSANRNHTVRLRENNLVGNRVFESAAVSMTTSPSFRPWLAEILIVVRPGNLQNYVARWLIINPEASTFQTQTTGVDQAQNRHVSTLTNGANATFAFTWQRNAPDINVTHLMTRVVCTILN